MNPETGKSEKIIDRLYEDRYNDPGSPLTVINEYGRAVLHIQDGVTLLMSGIGASPEGDKPFLDQFNMDTKETKRLWRSEPLYYERGFNHG